MIAKDKAWVKASLHSDKVRQFRKALAPVLFCSLEGFSPVRPAFVFVSDLFHDTEVLVDVFVSRVGEGGEVADVRSVGGDSSKCRRTFQIEPEDEQNEG